MKQFLLVITFLFSLSAISQEDGRVILRGKVLYRNVSVPNENVINATSEMATITNENGEYAIRVKVDDELVFSALNYQIEIVKITDEILKNNRLVIEVNEKVTELEEVVVTPEQQERFLQVKNKILKEEFEYEIDRSSEVENIGLSQSERGMQNGLNFVGIYKALAKALKKNKTEEKAPLKVSEVMRQVYDDEFFVVDLQLPQDKIDAFLFYCDTKMPTQSLLKKENEFELIEFLVTESQIFLAEIDDKK
ncbi:carboxypeptidase-like regulatory domain-containing protein [Maribacter sp. 2308TA10-17]|uniref:carboxypeptidase-like regulatory domain-containing protein n=1 Tax=Maribacter sp. 2308TA10-17 TaxID=3386276 RepID=UPI0039BCB319